MKKIIEWLKSRGYECTYEGDEYWRYQDTFHRGFYTMEKYKVSNDMYIRFKPTGKCRIYLYKNKRDAKVNEPCMVDPFSRKSFIERAVNCFPDKTGKDTVTVQKQSCRYDCNECMSGRK